MNQVDNNFVVVSQKNKLTETEYEVQKNHFLESGDMKMIIYCLNLAKSLPNEEIILVTEESATSNDSKLFKKIPAICKELNIAFMTLPELFKRHGNITFDFAQ